MSITVSTIQTAPVNHISWKAFFFALSYWLAPNVCPIKIPTAEPKATNTTFSKLQMALEIVSPATISNPLVE